MYTIYTDGGSRGNPGNSGIGAVIYGEGDSIIKEVSAYLGVRTNNWAEYEAVVQALEALKRIVPKSKRKNTSVIVKLDSQLVQRQLSGEYQIKEPGLYDQFIKIHNIQVADFPKLQFIHIPREDNQEADALANQAMDRGT